MGGRNVQRAAGAGTGTPKLADPVRYVSVRTIRAAATPACPHRCRTGTTLCCSTDAARLRLQRYAHRYRPDPREDPAVATVQRWTGKEAHALRQAMRLSVRGFARYLGVGARTVAAWDAHGERIVPRPEMQAALDTALR
jgi:hypothetical protein